MAFIRCFGKGKLDKMTLFTNYYETAAVILFGIGLTTLLLHKNMIKKIMGFNIMDTAIYLFLTSKGYIVGRLAPIVVNDDLRVETYVNPIPSGLVLTGIVVSGQCYGTDACYHCETV